MVGVRVKFEGHRWQRVVGSYRTEIMGRRL
jgi:hypothetical protein